MITALLLLLMTVLEYRGEALSGLGGLLYCYFWIGRIPIWSCMLSSTYNLLAITIDRYLLFAHPAWHRANLTKHNEFIILVMIWLFGPIFYCSYTIPTSTLKDGKCMLLHLWPDHTTPKVVGFIAVIIQYLFPTSLLIFCYGRMAYNLSKRIHYTNQMIPSNQNPTMHDELNDCENQLQEMNQDVPLKQMILSNQNPTMHDKPVNGDYQLQEINRTVPLNQMGPSIPNKTMYNEKQYGDNNLQVNNLEIERTPGTTVKNNCNTIYPLIIGRTMVIKTMVVVSGAFILCDSFNQWFFLLINVGILDHSAFSSMYYHFSVVMLFANCCVNPFIYAFEYRPFRQEIKKMLCIKFVYQSTSYLTTSRFGKSLD